MTERQVTAMRAIEAHEQTESRPPSLRELARVLEVEHTSALSLLKSLERKGWVVRAKRGEPMRILRYLSGKLPAGAAAGILVPVLGTVAAGEPIDAFLVQSEYYPVPREWIDGECYLLRVRGESMIGPPDFIKSGDLVLIRAQDSIEPAAIHVCWIPGVGATLKRVAIGEDVTKLVASNRSFAPIEASEGTIVQGRVVKLVRDFL